MSDLDLPPRCCILLIPRELIFKCLEYLLPQIGDTADTRYALSPGDLSDLLQCRLVCHVFYVISSSLVWRRVKFTLPGYRLSIPSSVSVAHDKVFKLTEIVGFVLNSTHLVKNTRLLIVLASGPSYDQAMRQTAVPTISSLVPLFVNVRVLSLDSVSILGSEVILQLLLCPSLHTVRLGNIDFSSFASLGRTANPKIKRLAIHHCKEPLELFKIMPSIQVFDGEIDEASISATKWPALNEVSFRSDVPIWNEVARIFLSWRQSRRNVTLSLTELMISQWSFNPKIKDFYSVIHPFAGHPLTKLTLYYVDNPSIENLELITRLFPSLQQLSLLSDEELTRWPDSIESYGSCLSSLNQLRLLEWNFYDDGLGDNVVYGDWNMVSEDRLLEVVLCLATYCAHLKEVRFRLVIDGCMGFRLRRDRYGQSDVESSFYTESLTFCTSSWAPFNFSDI